MEAQHVYSMLSQTLAASEDLGLAGSREIAGMGDMLFLFQATQERDPYEQGPSQ